MIHNDVQIVPIGSWSGLLRWAIGLLIVGTAAVYIYTNWSSSIATELRPQVVHIEGATLIPQSEVEALLPMTSSLATWLFDEYTVLAPLLAHPLVQRASLHRCSKLSLRCFRVEIQQRQVRYLTVHGTEAWLLGADGVVIGRAPPESIKDAADLGWTVVNFSNDSALAPSASSAESRRARMEIVRQFVALNSELGSKPVKQIEFLASGDLRLTFLGCNYSVIIDPSDEARIRTALRRLTQLLQELGEQTRLVSEIDLAFDRSGIVRWVQPVNGPSTQQK